MRISHSYLLAGANYSTVLVLCVCERERERERDLLGTVVASRGDLFRFASTIKYCMPRKKQGGGDGKSAPPPSERESEGVPQRVATISGI